MSHRRSSFARWASASDAAPPIDRRRVAHRLGVEEQPVERVRRDRSARGCCARCRPACSPSGGDARAPVAARSRSPATRTRARTGRAGTRGSRRRHPPSTIHPRRSPRLRPSRHAAACAATADRRGPARAHPEDRRRRGARRHPTASRDPAARSPNPRAASRRPPTATRRPPAARGAAAERSAECAHVGSRHVKAVPFDFTPSRG